MSRGDRREAIFVDDVDRQDFIKTLAEACAKADFRIHAFCLMPNHFHLVVETPNGNLVSGMRWLLSTYSQRLNRRHHLPGHVFSGRYKATVVDGSGDGYLKTACDYVHLNPVRARMIGAEDRLLAYPWSSLPWYFAAKEHRPAWLRTDLLLGEHGIAEDSAAGRQKFEQQMETRRQMENSDEYRSLRRGWCMGGEGFQQQLLEMIDGGLRASHSGQLRQETAETKAERIIAEELQRLGWTNADLAQRLKGDPAKMAIASRLRGETVLTMEWIAKRLSLGTAKSVRPRLQKWRNANLRDKAGLSADDGAPHQISTPLGNDSSADLALL
jgi:REP element-mobilizing transposase RayT